MLFLYKQKYKKTDDDNYLLADQTMINFPELEKYLNNASFVRWIIGKANYEDTVRWNKWEKQRPANRNLSKEARSIISKIRNQESSYPNPKTDLKKLLQSIEDYEFEKKLVSLRMHRHKNMPRYVAIAASVAILVGIAIFYNTIIRKQSESKTTNSVAAVQDFQTDYGQKSTLKLSDGSTIILNAHSTLKFAPDIDGKGNVDIWLNGEAYFSIRHLAGRNKRAFRIHTKDGVITDLGTKFAVNTRLDSTSVALVEGRIRIAIRRNGRDNKNKGQLLDQNVVATFKRGEKTIRIHHISTELYTSWITNDLVFKQTPLRQIVRRIEDTYGVRVVVFDKNLLSKKFSGSLKNNNLYVLEKALSLALKMPVYQKEKEVYIGRSVN